MVFFLHFQMFLYFWCTFLCSYIFCVRSNVLIFLVYVLIFFLNVLRFFSVCSNIFSVCSNIFSVGYNIFSAFSNIFSASSNIFSVCSNIFYVYSNRIRIVFTFFRTCKQKYPTKHLTGLKNITFESYLLISKTLLDQNDS